MSLAVPNRIKKNYGPTLVVHDEKIHELYNSLSKAERIYAYYLYRAALPGNRIICDQYHRFGLQIIDLFVKLRSICNMLATPELQSRPNWNLFVEQIDIYFVFLITNHGTYSVRSTSNNKKSPNSLELNELTFENVKYVFNYFKLYDEVKILVALNDAIFNENYEPTQTVQGDINSSAVNVYSPDFTNEDYENIPSEEKSKINVYFCKDSTGKIKIIPYSIRNKFNKYPRELAVSYYWLQKAHDHVLKHPEYFDEHTAKGLDYLMKFLEYGKEEYFEKHSIEWLKSSNRVDYCYGFIEVYKDPKSLRGFFQAEVTIQDVDIKKLNNLIPKLEERLPFPNEFKRDLSSDNKIINASINRKLYGSGDLGPALTTLAYCLPNYENIRETVGSKQIIYPRFTITNELSKRLYNSKETREWHAKYDPEYKMKDDLFNLLVILHETIGHASGKVSELGQGKKFHECLNPYSDAIEELRAEIIALYCCVTFIDELMENGFLSEWQLVPKQELCQKLILIMAGSGLSRLIMQSPDSKHLTGAHAIANHTIMNYLIENGGLEFVEQVEKIDDKEYNVVDLKIKNYNLALKLVEELMITVQTIKSNVDRDLGFELVERYGTPMLHPEYMKWLQENNKKINNGVNTISHLYPVLYASYDQNNEITDINALWIDNIFDHYLFENSRSMTTVN